MQFLNLDDSLAGPFDFEASEATLGIKVAVAITGVALAAALAAAALGYGPIALDYILAIFFLLLNAGMVSMVRHAKRPTNWLLRISGGRIQVKFRSYMNDHFPPEETQIVELARSELAWVRETKVRFVLNGSAYQSCKLLVRRCRFLEIGLAEGDLAQLDALLRAERTHPPVGKGRLKSKTSINPVRTAGPDAIRVLWYDSYSHIKPKLHAALDFFSRWVEVRPPLRESLHCTALALQSLPADEQAAALRQAVAVDSMAVASTIGLLRGCSLAEAIELADEL
jgi:hypothetical protein